MAAKIAAGFESCLIGDIVIGTNIPGALDVPTTIWSICVIRLFPTLRYIACGVFCYTSYLRHRFSYRLNDTQLLGSEYPSRYHFNVSAVIARRLHSYSHFPFFLVKTAESRPRTSVFLTID